MDWSKLRKQTKRNYHGSRASVPIRRELHWPWAFKSNSHSKDINNRKRHRNNQRIFAIILLLFSPVKVLANTSQTAAPVANSSGSVTNMAIQSLNGNLIQNQYGGNIVCQGPMLTFSPFVTDSHSFSTPREYWYEAPVYLDDGTISHYQNTRTGQKDNMSLNFGFSMTFSVPLDQSLQRRCKKAIDNQLARTNQMLLDSQLSWHIARIKECGQLKQSGIVLAKSSPYFKLCEDVIVTSRPNLPHTHKIIPVQK
jgi:hypothetical protein